MHKLYVIIQYQHNYHLQQYQQVVRAYTLPMVHKPSNMISGATNSIYAPSSLTSSTTYYCAVTSGSCGTVTSNNITIAVYGNLTAGISGGSSPICYNTNPGTFTATGSGGTGAYTYQWYTSPSNIISGATSSTYNPGNYNSKYRLLLFNNKR